MVRTKDPGGSALERLREFGLRYPGAHTKSPWPGHLDLAVNDKTFAYLSIAGEPLKVSCKLPRSADAALELPFTTPTAYGLGKSGWVTATFPDGTAVPVDLLEEWIDESYRAQAPKRLSAGVPPFGAGASIDREGPDGEPDDEAPPKPAAAASARVARRSTVKRESGGAAAATGRGTKRVAAKAARRATAAGAAKAQAAKVSATAVPSAKARAAKARGAARGAAKRPAARGASAALAKRDGVSRRAAKRPAKKRARPQA
jgi:predicted DNA-binding protein (MmcQ/YjbR family)